MKKETFEVSSTRFIDFHKEIKTCGWDLESYRKLAIRNMQDIKRNGLKELTEKDEVIKRLNRAYIYLTKCNSLLTDTIIEVTEKETNLEKLSYLEEISSLFNQKLETFIKEIDNG